MDHFWERHRYVMEMAKKNAEFCRDRDRFRDAEHSFYDYLNSQPQVVQGIILNYMTGFLCVNVRMFHMALENLRMPDEQEAEESREVL